MTKILRTITEDKLRDAIKAFNATGIDADNVINVLYNDSQYTIVYKL